MSVINLLDKKVYTQIAAGEVVERPSSVIKELVENSIDAGATEIKINIFGGGKDVIEVFDNGCGFYKADLLKSILPHATSKVKDLDDLYSIKTLGFRGEALSSIASVSKLRITTKRREDDIGYTMEVAGGEDPVVYEAPSNDGTYITVSNLFFNVPARQKFLKSARSEENDVTDTVSRLVLANPNVAFKFLIEDTLVMSSYGDGIEDAVTAVYGNEFLDQTFNISNYLHGVTIKGYVGKINYTKANRTYQTVVLNGRYIQNQTISSAIMNAYSGYLMKRRYPMAVLYITMPSEFVDVNVTPNKADVRFIDNSVVYGAIYKTISNVLDGTDTALDIVLPTEPIYHKSPEAVKNEQESKTDDTDEVVLVTSRGVEPLKEKYKVDKFDDNLFSSFSIFNEDKNVNSSDSQENSDNFKIDYFEENKRYISEFEARGSTIQQELSQPKELKFVAQVLNSFLIFEMAGDIYFIDQHAAHERLLYNKLLYQRTLSEKPTQPLLVPYNFKVNTLEREFVLEKMPFLTDLGFEIELISDGSFNVYSIPYELIDLELEKFFEDVLCDHALRRDTVPESIERKLMQKACKSAVKAGMSLDKSEVDALITLLNGNINLKCPHGRPIAVRITRHEIDKWFKRVL